MNPSHSAEPTLALIRNSTDMLACPACWGATSKAYHREHLECGDCHRVFSLADGIPRLFLPNEWSAKDDVTETVPAFYESTTFPNYNDIDCEWTLREKAKRGIFARLLGEELSLAEMRVSAL